MDIEEFINNELQKFCKSVENELDIGIEEASVLLKNKLEQESKRVIDHPKKYHKNFIIKKYPGFKSFVGNTTTTNNKIPLSHILENGAFRKKRGYMPARPHFKKAYDLVENELIKKIERRIEKNAKN